MTPWKAAVEYLYGNVAKGKNGEKKEKEERRKKDFAKVVSRVFSDSR